MTELVVLLIGEPPSGDGQSTMTLADQGVGWTIKSGFAAVALTLALVGVGEAPIIPVPEGFGVPALTLGVSGTGVELAKGYGVPATVLVCTGTGEAPAS